MYGELAGALATATAKENADAAALFRDAIGEPGSMSRETDHVGEQLIAFLPNMRRFAISLCGSPDVADDLVQGACERALANAGAYQPGTRFDAWMFRIIRNLWIDRMRKQRTAGPTEDIEERRDISGASAVQEIEARSALRSVAAAIAELPMEQREVLLLVCVEDLSYQDAANLLSIPIGTVMSRLARARKKLGEVTGITAEAARLPAAKGGHT
jgi:RNA polymerase sigma-70 factor, ECF subfamily